MPVVSFPAPRRGWIKNSAYIKSPLDAAEVLDNVFPTAQGARVRKGTALHATTGDAVRSLFTYSGGGADVMFAATDTDIYDVTSPTDPAVAPSASVNSLTSGDWAGQNFSTSGGEFLTIVNGADTLRQFDGSSWSAPSITGVTSSDLSHVWSFKNRLWFIEGGTMSAWYLATNAVSGAATEFPLRGVFNLGGALLFGATWSLDAGDGIDDVIVFATDMGEIAVYQGTDPGSDFALSGVYRIGKPLGQNDHFRAGGDLAILTEDGIVSVAEALRKDRGALQQSALTYPIEDAWNEAVANRTSNNPIAAHLWPSQSMLVIGTPTLTGTAQTAYVANSKTGAWCRFTGLDIRCLGLLDDRLYFGTSEGTIVEMETGGSDQGSPYGAQWIPKFQEGDPSIKQAKMARFRGLATQTYTVGLACFQDYETADQTAVANTATASDSVWGTAVWGQFVWGGEQRRIYVSSWQVVNGFGASLAPGVQVEVNKTDIPALDFVALDLIYAAGFVV